MRNARANAIGLPESLPEGWSAQPIKRLYDVELGKMLQSEPASERDILRPYLRAANVASHGVDVSDVRQMWFTPTDWKRTRLENGDLLISEGGDVGRPAIWSGELEECGFQNAINRARPTGHLSSKYLLYVMTALRANGAIDVVCNKATIPHFTAEKVAATIIPVPPAATARRIVGYLDAETTRVDALVDSKLRFIELLLERRAALIAHAVTKGLDPDAEMKDSGVEWLGLMPARWTATRIKNVARLCSGHTPDKKIAAYWDGGTIPWISLADSGFLRLNRYVSQTSYYTTAEGIANSSAVILPAGSVILSRDATVGLCAISQVDLAVSQHFMAWTCGSTVDNEYLLYVLDAMKQELERLSMGSTIPTIGLPHIKDLAMPLPALEEQRAIVRYLHEHLAHIDEVVETSRKSIDLLREYRVALIATAVTGQIDIPGTQTSEEVA